MLNNEIYRPIRQELNLVEENLRGLLQTKDTFISDAINKILYAGGKRLRPALLLLSAKLCNYSGDRGIKLATAIELIHTASLIHDDIIDHDALRRGIPTINSQLGDTTSVILGDFLYSLVFEILAEDGDIDIIRSVARTTSQMAKGDLRQVLNQFNTDLTEEKYLSINADKTASLISCACWIGAMIGSQSNGEVDILQRYGMNLGMAFQITDDLLDITADEKVFGKPLGSDIREGKLTLPLIYTMRFASKKDRAWIRDTFKSRHIDKDASYQIQKMVKQYNGIEYSFKKAQEYRNECKQELTLLENSDCQETLAQFADYVVERVY